MINPKALGKIEEDSVFNLYIYNGNIGSGFHLENDEGTQIEGDFILMQWTGLKDKNGKEIYEGDIVSHGRTKWQREFIVFENGSFVHKNKLDDSEGIGGSMWVNRNFITKNCKIVGNIYENEELL